MSSGRSNDARSKSGRSQHRNPDEGVSDLTTMLPETFAGADHSSRPAKNSIQSAVKSSGGDLDETISQFQSELHQKDELISALISELEKAVEQLDRIERTGTSHSQSAQNLPRGDVLRQTSDRQGPLMDDLRLMAEEWNQAQPVSILDRIESQLAAVHDMVANLRGENCTSPEVADFEQRIRRMNQESDESSQADSVNVTLDETSPSWDLIKNQIFANEGTTPEEQLLPHDPELLKLLREIPTPREVSFTSADVEELKQAISERDEYIIQLNRLFRTWNPFALPTDWAELGKVPADLQVRVEALIEHLDVQVRLGEVEMSLERARLARERSQIQAEREQIEKHMRRLGLKSLSDLDSIGTASGTSSDRRWMRFLGPNTK